MLHAYIVMKRLKAIGTEASATSQALFDWMFADMDKNVREMGVGDLSVGKKIKAMATAYYGRIKAYDEGLEGGQELLTDALRRNLFAEAKPTDRQVTDMADFTLRPGPGVVFLVTRRYQKRRHQLYHPPKR